MCWYYYYRNATDFFWELRDLTEVEKNLMKVGEIAPVDVLQKTLNSLAVTVMKDCIKKVEANDNSCDLALILCKYPILYENVRKSQGIKEFYTNDYITLSTLYLHGHDRNKGIEFGLQALSGIWPAHTDPLYIFKISPDYLKGLMARGYYWEHKFVDALNYHLMIPKINWNMQDYLHISHMFAASELWE